MDETLFCVNGKLYWAWMILNTQNGDTYFAVRPSRGSHRFIRMIYYFWPHMLKIRRDVIPYLSYNHALNANMVSAACNCGLSVRFWAACIASPCMLHGQEILGEIIGSKKT